MREDAYLDTYWEDTFGGTLGHGIVDEVPRDWWENIEWDEDEWEDED
jgi:hypothetical protein